MIKRDIILINQDIKLDYIMYSSEVKDRLIDALHNYTYYYNNINILDNNITEQWKRWLVEFTDGEGSFRINIKDDYNYPDIPRWIYV
jgi:hypothetical protein